MVTVRDRIRALGLAYSKRLHWSAGAAIRERWRDLHDGELPEKQLRQKTLRDGGSHCFAVYPDDFVPEIDRILRTFQAARDRQRDLFA